MAASDGIPAAMSAILAENDKCIVKSVDTPKPSGSEVLVKVAATAINRADTLQRKGAIPPPPGATPILGLEASGTVVAHGSECTMLEKFPVGAKVMALLIGGGHGEYVLVDESHLMQVPEGVDIVTAGGIPETWLTAYQLLHTIGGVKAGDFVLVLAAGSGVGTAAIQLAVAAGAKPIAVAGTAAKLENAAKLGAVATFNYKDGGYGEGVKAAADGRGVNIVLDCVGGSLWGENAQAIAMEGRWVLYGLMGGPSPDGPVLAHLLRKRVRLEATTLRARSDEYKAQLVAGLTPLLPHFTDGSFSVVVDTVYEGLDKVQEAHERIQSNANMGKLIVKL